MKKSLLLILPLAFVLMSYGTPRQKVTSDNQGYMQFFNDGVKAQKNGDYQEAIDDYQKAINIKPDFAGALSNMGYCYRQMARDLMLRSQDAYKRALSIDPNYAEAIEYQGELYLMMGDLTKAYKNYQTLKQQNSSEAGELKEKIDDIVSQAKKIQEQ